MRIKKISTLEEWEILSAALKENGYGLWQMQYSYDSTEGFHAWFWKKDKEDAEVITFNKDVQEKILSYNKFIK